MKKHCQSCGMPLKQGQADLRGSEISGTRSEVYCNRCYLNGKFTNDMTVDEMIDFNINLIKQSKENKFKKWLLIRSYPAMIRRLKRWN